MLIGTFIFSYSLLRRVEDPDTSRTSASPPAASSSAPGSCSSSSSSTASSTGCGRSRWPRSSRRQAGCRCGACRAHGVVAATQADDDEIRALAERPPALVARSDRPGAIQAIDEAGLVAWAREHDCVLVLPHAVGDFVSSGATLVEVHGDVTPTPHARAAACAGRSRSASSGRSTRIRRSRSGSSSTSRSARSRRRSTTRPRRSRCSTTSRTRSTLIGTTPGLDGRWEFHDAEGRLRVVMPAQRWDGLPRARRDRDPRVRRDVDPGRPPAAGDAARAARARCCPSTSPRSSASWRALERRPRRVLRRHGRPRARRRVRTARASAARARSPDALARLRMLAARSDGASVVG